MSRNIHRLGRLLSSSKLGSLHSLTGSRSSVWFGTYRSVPSSIQVTNYFSSSSQFALCQQASTSGQTSKQDDRIKMFIDPRVQSLLKELTGRDLKRVFRKRKLGQKLREPKYTFMTEAQLEKARQEAEARADMLLQMPPVLRPREPIDKILSFDPYIQGEEKSTLIFTDITMNVSNRDRIIVARDPDGTLRQATWEEREKMNKCYFPIPGREFLIPKMFADPELLRNVLNRASEEDNTYEFVLDRACLQFEPDDPLYVSAAEMTYDAIDSRGHYDFLKSTRHFGPMVFHYVRTRKMDGILLHSLKCGRVSCDAVKLISLFQIMFPECKSAKSTASNDVDKVRQYIQLDGIRKGELELALNAYVEEEERKSELEEGLKRQHGIQ